jgi:hypothetical protein
MIRVDFEELDFSDDGYGDLVYQGDAFTGIATETTAHGKLIAESYHRLGKQHGPTLEWDENGTLRREATYCMGSPTGLLREWDERGKMQIEEIWEHRVLLWRKRWDENGVLVEDASQLNPYCIETWISRRCVGRPVLLVLEGNEVVERPWPYDALVPPDAHARVVPWKRPGK